MTPEQFNAVYRQALPEISRFLARRVDQSVVEEIASELFEIAWNKRDSIPKDLEMPWLYKTARYLISNHRRKEQNRSRIFSMVSSPESAPSAESIALADVGLAQAWRQLKPQEQELISLWAMDGLTHQEIALVLEISANACAIRLTRAKQHLKELLETENSESVGTL